MKDKDILNMLGLNDRTITLTADDEYLQIKQGCDLLNQQDQRIAELEEQLKDAIIPKFKIGKVCFALLGNTIEEVAIVGARLKLSKIEDENFTMYSITDSQGCACSVME